MGVAGCALHDDWLMLSGEVTDKFVQSSDNGVGESLAVERGNVSFAELLDDASKGDGHGEEIHIRNQGDELIVVGIAVALGGTGVGVTPGLVLESNLPALQAGRQDLGTETDLGHRRRLLFDLAAKEKARRSGLLWSLFLFYGNERNSRPRKAGVRLLGAGMRESKVTEKQLPATSFVSSLRGWSLLYKYPVHAGLKVRIGLRSVVSQVSKSRPGAPGARRYGQPSSR